MSAVPFFVYANKSIINVVATPSTISPARMKHISLTKKLFFISFPLLNIRRIYRKLKHREIAVGNSLSRSGNLELLISL